MNKRVMEKETVKPKTFCNLDADLNNSSVVFVHKIGLVYAEVSTTPCSIKWYVSKYRITPLSNNTPKP